MGIGPSGLTRAEHSKVGVLLALHHSNFTAQLIGQAVLLHEAGLYSYYYGVYSLATHCRVARKGPDAVL